MELIQDKQSLLIISLVGLVMFVIMVWQIFEIGKLYAAKRFSEAERMTNLLTVVAAVCAIVQFLVYELNVPIVWLVIVGYMQWEKYQMRKRLPKAQP